MSKKNNIINIARLSVLISLGFLVVFLSLENWLMSPTSISRWLIQVIPLVAFIPALSKQQLRAYQWLCFLILFYFLMAVLAIFTPGKTLFGSLETFFCALLFSSAILYIHKKQRADATNKSEELNQ